MSAHERRRRRRQLRLAKAGAIVLTRRGQLLPDGRYGDRVVRVGGMRVAGYDDPYMRRAGRRYLPIRTITAAQQTAFGRGCVASATSTW